MQPIHHLSKIYELLHWQHKMSDFIKVQGYSSLVRDTRTNAVINKDKKRIILQKEEQRKHKDKEMK